MLPKLLQGSAAEALLKDPNFKDEWHRLMQRCPWATPFQTPEFVLAWYSAYQGTHQAVLVIARAPSGALSGLLPLALRDETELMAAGGIQAEYQAWICAADVCDEFARDALRAVRSAFPGQSLRFHYLPPGIPLTWLNEPTRAGRFLLETHRRPQWRLEDGSSIAQSLAKRTNRRKLKELEQHGEVRLEHISDPAQLSACFDEIVAHYDARRLAVDGSQPFANDPRKKAFHLAIAAESNLAHVTLLRVGDQIASAHIGMHRGRQLHLWFIAHNPRFAEYSPGKFHLLLLAKQLHEEGFEQIDLTPGGEAYKDRSANAADEVHTLSLFATAFARWKGTMLASAKRMARWLTARLSLKPARVKTYAMGLYRHRVLGLPRLTTRSFWRSHPRRLLR